jgi:uncharacterized membrane protein SpoIIM required for sporulation
MRESSFIDQNQEKWEAFEEILDRKDRDPDELSDLFMQVTDDLSFSRTFYPHRLVRAYLNGLAQKVYFSIYKTKRSRRSRLVEFWKEELPAIIWDSRREFLLSLLLFGFSMAIGVFSSAMDPDFARVILGDGYVAMTEGNIAAGDPMAVYKDEESLGMSLYIISNNLFVAFLTFFSGVLFAVGTVGILIRNGVMVGVFQYFFVERGLFEESFLTIWMHGALEIPAIVIAGAAGLTMGRGLVFPGTLSRMKAFQFSARRGLKIMLSLVPVFIVAGLIEGFLTRHTELPDIFRALFIFSCFALIGWYYLWYPLRKARRGFRSGLADPLLHPDGDEVVDFHRIQSGGEIFSGAFALYRRDLGRIMGRSALAALVFCALIFPFAGQEPAVLFVFSWEFMGMMKVLPDLIRHPSVPWMPFLQILLFTWLVAGYFRFIRQAAMREYEGQVAASGVLLLWLKAALGGALLVILLLPQHGLTVLLFLLTAPLILLWVYVMLWEGRNALQSLGRFFELLLPQLGRYLGFALLLASVGYLFFLLLDSLILWLVFETVGLNFSFSQPVMDNIAAVLLAFLTLFLLFALLGAMVYGAALLYFTLLEIRDAPHLRSRIAKVSPQRRIQGLPRE